MHQQTIGLGVVAWLLTLATALQAQPTDTPRSFVELRRFPATEAVQGVAVDEAHVYVIASRAIGKYDRQTAEKHVGRRARARVRAGSAR